VIIRLKTSARSQLFPIRVTSSGRANSQCRDHRQMVRLGTQTLIQISLQGADHCDSSGHGHQGDYKVRATFRCRRLRRTVRRSGGVTTQRPNQRQTAGANGKHRSMSIRNSAFRQLAAVQYNNEVVVYAHTTFLAGIYLVARTES
jgi:hypothetical protein